VILALIGLDGEGLDMGATTSAWQTSVSFSLIGGPSAQPVTVPEVQSRTRAGIVRDSKIQDKG
jgi:hypothetical protein